MLKYRLQLQLGNEWDDWFSFTLSLTYVCCMRDKPEKYYCSFRLQKSDPFFFLPDAEKSHISVGELTFKKKLFQIKSILRLWQ